MGELTREIRHYISGSEVAGTLAASGPRTWEGPVLRPDGPKSVRFVCA